MNQQLSQRSDIKHHTVQGLLNLAFTYDQYSQCTRLTTREQRPPLKVIRAFPLPNSAVLLHLHNLSGGVLGGDQLALSVTVGTQASVQLTTTSATRIYRTRPDTDSAFQSNVLSIQTGGLLEYLPDPIIPFAASRYQQHTTIDLAHDAGLFWWETLAPGRTAYGERFAYTELSCALTINALGKPIAIERFKLTPQSQDLSSPLRLGPYSHSSSFYICRVGLEPGHWLSLEQSLSIIAQQLTHPGEITWAVSTLVKHGLVVRALSQTGRAIPSGLFSFWQAAKQALYAQEAILPRKIY